jgi:hypothetical protein
LYRLGVEVSPQFVPDDFEPPRGFVSAGFALEPLGPQHNEADHAAWSSSMVQIRATPGFVDRSWPHEMSLAENLGDLEMHARDFEERLGFTYTVLDPVDGDVIGCVYIYPVGAADAHTAAEGAIHDASVRSWVRSDRAALDEPIWRVVSDWLREEWPFGRVAYAARP